MIGMPIMRARIKLGAAMIPAVAVGSAWLSTASAEQTQLSLPEVTVTAPAAVVAPPYLREPGKADARNPYSGRYRVEEDKFPVVPCTETRIAAVAGSKCLLGYRLIPGQTDQITNPKGGSNCDIALDAVMYNTGDLSIEADTTITDPYKVTAIGFHSQYCYVSGYPGYNQEDFQDMNQVTRRGTNWHNLGGDGEDKSIEFFEGPHQCVAVKRAGPPWQGGYIYMVHASICRTDAAPVRPADIAYALGLLQIRQYDPTGNLRRPGR
ncbi:MAG: hypothetical protein ACREE2_02205 [Stellaceae bacterium]